MDLAQKHRPFGIKVTDLSSQMWCEKQLEFSLTKPRVRTAEMKKGEEIHTEKEEEIYEMVQVMPRTWDDRLLLNIHNDITALQGLIDDGIARELFLWGRFSTLKVVGVADELKTVDSRLVLSDTKTRKSPTMPRIAQQRPTRFQLMAYKQLFEDISFGAYTAKDLLRHYFKDAESSASDEFVAQHKELGREFEPNVLKAARMAFDLFKKMPPVEKMEVSYEAQGSRELIGKHEFGFDNIEFTEHVTFCSQFWRGERDAMGVAEHNSWKCSYCQYRGECPAVEGFLNRDK